MGSVWFGDVTSWIYPPKLQLLKAAWPLVEIHPTPLPEGIFTQIWTFIDKMDVFGKEVCCVQGVPTTPTCGHADLARKGV